MVTIVPHHFPPQANDTPSGPLAGKINRQVFAAHVLPYLTFRDAQAVQITHKHAGIPDADHAAGIKKAAESNKSVSYDEITLYHQLTGNHLSSDKVQELDCSFEVLTDADVIALLQRFPNLTRIHIGQVDNPDYFHQHYPHINCMFGIIGVNRKLFKRMGNIVLYRAAETFKDKAWKLAKAVGTAVWNNKDTIVVAVAAAFLKNWKVGISAGVFYGIGKEIYKNS